MSSARPYELFHKVYTKFLTAADIHGTVSLDRTAEANEVHIMPQASTDAKRQMVIEELLTRAVNLLGEIALRKRNKLSRYQAYALGQELFGVLEELNDLRCKATRAAQ